MAHKPPQNQPQVSSSQQKSARDNVLRNLTFPSIETFAAIKHDGNYEEQKSQAQTKPMQN